MARLSNNAFLLPSLQPTLTPPLSFPPRPPTFLQFFTSHCFTGSNFAMISGAS